MVSFGTMFIVILIIAAGGAIAFWPKISKMLNGDTDNETVSNDEVTVAAAEAPVQDKSDIMLDALLKFNIALRDKLSNDSVLTETEKVIDLIKELIEPVNTVHLSEMTPVVNRMGTVYLPTLIHPYMNLSVDEQHNNASVVIDKLSALKTELMKVKNHLDSNNTAAFDKQAEFISAMFTDTNDNF